MTSYSLPTPNPLSPSKAPNLQVPPTAYSYQYQNQLTNQIKIYFNSIDNNNYQLIQKSGSSAVISWIATGA